MGETLRKVLLSARKQSCDERAAVMALLYPNRTFSGGTDGTTNRLINDFLNSFSRFAGNQQTYADRGGSYSLASKGSMLEKQVERALTQVLGRSLALGNNPDTFMSAVNSAFPTTADGQVSPTPRRSVVSLYSSNGNGSYPYSNGRSGSMVGQLSTKQATLYRQASVMVADALSVLKGIQTFMPEADTEEVEALRALIISEFNAIVEELGRVDEPRKTRVDAYLATLQVNLVEFGSRGFLDDPTLVTTVGNEAQTANFQLLLNYLQILVNIWNTFKQTEGSTPTFSLSELVERANVVLPVVAQSTIDLEAALDSVGFGENEQRSLAAKLTTLDTSQITASGLSKFLDATVLPKDLTLLNQIFNAGFQLPDITVRDLIDWLDRFASTEGPTILTDSGNFGLTFITDQADSLFWTVVPVVYVLQLSDSLNATSRLMLRQVLSNERVRWAFDNLLDQLKVLADLACPDKTSARFSLR